MPGTNWKDAVQFSRSEQRGVIVLILLCCLSMLYSHFVPAIVSRREIARFEKKLAVFPLADPTEGRIHDSIGPELMNTPELPEKAVNVQQPVKRSSADVRNRYKPSVAEKLPATHELAELRINSDDAMEIMRTGLLDRTMAYRLVRFREQAGGFHSVEQLRDIYGMTDTLYGTIVDHVVFEEVSVKKLSVNSASTEELQVHPYISKGLAAQMVNFREKVGPFNSASDLSRLYFMTDELLEKLKPYISFY